MNRHTAGAVAGAAALLIALTGCTPADSDAASAEEQSPLEAYLAAAWGGDLSEEEQTARLEKENAEREELVATCMTEEGFEYIPATYSGGVSYDAGGYEPDSREWVAQYGYGMINYPGQDEPVEPGEEWVDPNQDYVASLSESEMNAYYEALYGPTPTEEEMGDDGAYEWDWTQSGCHGWAQHEMEGDNPFTADEHQPLMDAMNEFYMSISQAPELAELDAEWAACMDENGYPGFTAQSDASNSISDELNAHWESVTEYVENDPVLDELGEREIELALVDLDCREKTDYRAESRRVTAVLEEQFIEDHKAELDAFKAAAEQANR
ncbi:hypothetical protein NQ166_05340 [Microbacterium sp. zg.Y1090]|uniref:hypothetical protein n=1 Tax=Microbacterium TaxID=33882 RepID=UPI00214AB72F|nr:MULTISPECIES: hypothetical protein [unclassified Microbacterium]MCR2813405.1 hypothetical protein [Microbacterium sp. zg.Y1084]MCR2818259.1 hypothetical protein [Microbacterium sp. zg.Y1090]WIM27596.1 hypothetical protein QNO26_10575 [Microbacterium sp. zg-Y1090]